jgi:circadian clock protein KaiC
MSDWPKTPTGISGFDALAQGGLPRGRSTVVGGTPGSGKTLFAMQFLASGIREFSEPGVCVTFEERPEDLIRNVDSFGWNLDRLVADRQLAFVDCSPDIDDAREETGSYDLSALLARIENAVSAVKATRLAADAIVTLLGRFRDSGIVRSELHRIHEGLRRMGVTSLITMERTDDDGTVGRLGVEEFVADNVLLLRNRLEQERRRRTIEILKFRGANHRKGEHPFTIDSEHGVTVIPISAVDPVERRTNERVSSGVTQLDEMCGGGLFPDSIILVSGATGTGKTLLATHFVSAAVTANQRVLLVGSEESRDQLIRNARSWGVDYEAAEGSGLLKMIACYPEELGTEDHFLQLRKAIATFRPMRVAIDSVSAFERVATPPMFREFVIALTSFIKQEGITGLFTNTTALLSGGGSITESHFSTITDTVILLRYVELYGEVRRGLAVLKVRGSAHQREIREYVIDDSGMHVRSPFRNVHGIITGTPSYVVGDEKARLDDMFDA